MKKRKIILRVLLILIVIIAIGSTIIYFVYESQNKPWKAFYVACCGGILIVNLIISMIFVYKNIRQ